MQIAQDYGEIAHFKFGRQHVYLVDSPVYIENILIRDYKNFIKSRGLQVSKRLLGEGLVTSEGGYHDRQRRTIQPAFHPDRIKSYGNIMIDYAEQMSEGWEDGSAIDIHGEMMHVTSAIIAKSVLGSDIAGSSESDKVNDALLTSMQYLNRIMMPFGELIEKIPILPVNKDFRAAKNTLDSIVYRMIREHRDREIKKGEKAEVPKVDNNSDDDVAAIHNDKERITDMHGHRPRYDLLQTLMEAQDPERNGNDDDNNNNGKNSTRMSDAQLRDEVMTIFLAGHETTASALTWTFYLLSQYPDVERQLYSEICSVLGNDKEGDGPYSSSAGQAGTYIARLPTIEDIPKLKYTERVLRESMRLYPPAWTIGRQALADYAIDSRYVIPRGSIILMSQYVMHHNPRYFSDPDTFDPDRWTKEFKSALPRFCYFPFGGGIRGCIGESFAWMEGILVLATICRKWKMHHDSTHKVELKPLITLRPKYGMRMTLERRRK